MGLSAFLLYFLLIPAMEALYGRRVRVMTQARQVVAAVGPPARLPAVPLPDTDAVVIHEARYGAQGKWVVVTDVVRRYVSGGRLSIPVNNDLFGDPIVGFGKELAINYSVGPGGKQVEKRWPEGEGNESIATLP